MPEDEAGSTHSSPERPRLLSRLVRMNRYLLLLLLVPAGVIYFWPQWHEQEIAREKLAAVKLRHDALAHQSERLAKKLQLIKNDPEYLETVARDELGMQKDGEIILHFED